LKSGPDAAALVAVLPGSLARIARRQQIQEKDLRIRVCPLIVKPTEARAPLAIELYGIMGSFVNGSVHFAMVAEEGLEPPTRGL
jgi:hypothetical protein